MIILSFRPKVKKKQGTQQKLEKCDTFLQISVKRREERSKGYRSATVYSFFSPRS